MIALQRNWDKISRGDVVGHVNEVGSERVCRLHLRLYNVKCLSNQTCSSEEEEQIRKIDTERSFEKRKA